MAQAMRALLLTPILGGMLRPSTHRSLPHRTALGAVAGGLGDAGPADDAKVRAWAPQLRAVAAKRSPPAAAGVAIGLPAAAATGRVSPKFAARLVFGSFVLLSTALVAPERAAVEKRQKRVPAVVIARQLAIAAGAAVVHLAPTRRSAARLRSSRRSPLGPRRRGRLRRTRRDKGGGAAREPRVRARRPLRGGVRRNKTSRGGLQEVAGPRGLGAAVQADGGAGRLRESLGGQLLDGGQAAAATGEVRVVQCIVYRSKILFF